MGNKTVILKANDTDVNVIAIASLGTQQQLGHHELWVMFGQGPTLRWIAIHDIVKVIGPTSKQSGLLFFHAFTGCDVTSTFRGKG